MLQINEQEVTQITKKTRIEFHWEQTETREEERLK